jgi:hypothetical protein
MNHIIIDLIQKLEASPHKVATKEYVLNRLRESQRHEVDFHEHSPIDFPTHVKTDAECVKVGDGN